MNLWYVGSLAGTVIASLFLAFYHVHLRAIPGHASWMYNQDMQLISVMGFVALGEQNPPYETHLYYPLHSKSIDARAIVANIQSNDVIVVLRRSLEDVVSRITPSTPPFVLVSVNFDDAVDVKLQQQIAALPNILAFYGQNLQTALTPSKIYPLPLGYRSHESETPLADELRALAARKTLATGVIKKVPKILINFSLQAGYDKRRDYLSALGHLDYVDHVEHIPYDEYFETISRYAFVLSPPGNGYDCFRTWEAMAVGTIPIVHNDGEFDRRLFDNTSAWVVSSANDIIDEYVQHVEQAMVETITANLPDTLTLDYWSKRLHRH